MRLPILISLPNEPFLEKWARLLRFRQADSIIADKLLSNKLITLVDFGCGQDILYFKYLHHEFPNEASHIVYKGIDPLLPRSSKQGKQVELIKSKFENLQLKTHADIVTMFAVFEHVDDPGKLLQLALEILKPDGVLVLTTPTPMAKACLEFFSAGLGIISQREIDEHKRYPTRTSLLGYVQSLRETGIRVSTTHKYFEWGLNNLLVITKQNP